jgi:nitrogen fixation protein FixH
VKTEAKPTFELNGAHVLWILLFFFGAIIAVNIGFGVLALKTFPGEDVRHSYIQGLEYNQTLAERAREHALGWRASVGFSSQSTAPLVIVTLHDAAGAPIDGASLQGLLRRPVFAALDQPLRFEPMGQGVYQAKLNALAPGVWDLRAKAQSQGRLYSVERRLTWP